MSILTPQTDIIIELREILLWIEALKTKMKFWVKQTSKQGVIVKLENWVLFE